MIIDLISVKRSISSALFLWDFLSLIPEWLLWVQHQHVDTSGVYLYVRLIFQATCSFQG
jgi:hypothetical protein